MSRVVAQESFPRQFARTGRFTRGAPRALSIDETGSRVLFLRSSSGTDPAAALWAFDVEAGAERLLADPHELLGGGEEQLSAAERALRERARESGSGVVAFATDDRATVAAFALSGRLWLTDVATGTTRELTATGPVIDPRPDPTGRRVAYVGGRSLRVVDLASDEDRPLAEPDGDDVTWGLADFVAAEEMGRTRGFWWSPAGDRLLVARVDESPVQRWWIGDPAQPGAQPAVHRYPSAGTPNADVRLFVIDVTGDRTEVQWDRERFEYVVTAGWGRGGLLVVVQSRDQRTMQLRSVDPTNGETSLVREDTDPVWLEVVPGVPAWSGGRLVWAADLDGWRRLVVDGEPVTPPGLQVRAVRDADDEGVLFVASEEPTEIDVWQWTPDRLRRLTPARGVHAATSRGGTTAFLSAQLDDFGTTVTIHRDGRPVGMIGSRASTPVLTPHVLLTRTGPRELRTALVLPSAYDPESGPLPVLMHPYGGPHAQRVLSQRAAYLTDQWLADQGFAVVLIDGRGTPGRGSDWERAIADDLPGAVLQDQVDGLQALGQEHPELDLRRVGILGWSFGGYLAALAVLRRPDVFHAAVAGAPVTDWTLYDTHYTERYLGHPATAPERYAAVSLIADAHRLERPLMIIHGLADDNVVAANSVRLSGALLAAGRPHTLLPLSGVTHMTPQEEVAENLLLLQVQFLREALGLR